jgi:RNA polymerase sigma-70 factor (ECF subfamily)
MTSPLSWLRTRLRRSGVAGPGAPDSAGVGDEAAGATAADQALVEGLQAGDEEAFTTLVERYHGSLFRVALLYVSDPAVAEEVVQETWLGVFQGIHRFEGRSALKTWLFRILTNCAKTRGQREGRTVPFSAVWNDAEQPGEPAVDPGRFGAGGYWLASPQSWEGQPEQRLLAAETQDVVQEAIATLPPSQQQVIVLRDIEGWTAAEVCNALEISETNQRVLLHRGRSRVRRALEQYLAGEPTTP